MGASISPVERALLGGTYLCIPKHTGFQHLDIIHKEAEARATVGPQVYLLSQVNLQTHCAVHRGGTHCDKLFKVVVLTLTVAGIVNLV